MSEPVSPFSSLFRVMFPFMIVFYVHFTSRIILSPLSPVIRTHLDLSITMTGNLFLCIALGGACGLLMSGWVASRLPHRWVITFATLLSGSLLLTASLLPGYLPLAVCLFGVGVSAGLYFPSSMASFTTEISSRVWGRAMALHEAAPNLSFVLSPLLVEAALRTLSWRDVLFCTGMAQFLSAALFLLSGRGGRFTGTVLSRSGLKAILRRSFFWAMIGCFCLAVGAAMGPYIMLPLYLTEVHGFTREGANHLLSLSRIAGIGMAFFAGWLTDAWGVVRTLRLYFICIGMATALIGFASGGLLTAAVFVQPALSVVYFPAAFTTIAKAFDKTHRSLALSFITPVGVVVGQGLVPPGIGLLADAGAFRVGFILLGGLLFCGLLFLPVINKQCFAEEP